MGKVWIVDKNMSKEDIEFGKDYWRNRYGEELEVIYERRDTCNDRNDIDG